jgi:hypothetical protein
MKKWTVLLPLILLPLLACDESLPTRQQPQTTLTISDVIYVQGYYNFGPFMEFVFLITNLYEETFQEEVKINGQITIWWVNHPEIRATVEIGNQHLVPPSKISGNTLTIDPGGRCALKIYWYLQLEDGRSLIDLLDYSGSVPSGGLIKSKTETFMMEGNIKLFDQLGYLYSPPMKFEFYGLKQAANPDNAGITLADPPAVR